MNKLKELTRRKTIVCDLEEYLKIDPQFLSCEIMYENDLEKKLYDTYDIKLLDLFNIYKPIKIRIKFLSTMVIDKYIDYIIFEKMKCQKDVLMKNFVLEIIHQKNKFLLDNFEDYQKYGLRIDNTWYIINKD